MTNSLLATISTQNSCQNQGSDEFLTTFKVNFMTRSPLTPIGLQGKTEELYQLSDTDLQAEAIAVQVDFKSWVKEHFFLSKKQKEYVNNLGIQTTNYFGSQCSICFSNRLPIELIYPIPPGTDYSKWTGTANSLVVKSDGSGKTVATGSLTFEFTYTV